ncbi:MAG: GNAT family N-acetyltransferase [Ferruginibacter sp.]
MFNYIIANTSEEYNHTALLFKEYAAWLNIDLGFQHFEEELKELKTMYGLPGGGIILCEVDNKFIACVAVRKIDNKTAELKRMFVQPAYQRHGIGKILLEKAIELAIAEKYSYIRLDTLNYMTSAISLYRQYGFYEIPAYYHNPNTTAVYFELRC